MALPSGTSPYTGEWSENWRGKWNRILDSTHCECHDVAGSTSKMKSCECPRWMSSISGLRKRWIRKRHVVSCYVHILDFVHFAWITCFRWISRAHSKWCKLCFFEESEWKKWMAINDAIYLPLQYTLCPSSLLVFIRILLGSITDWFPADRDWIPSTAP